MSIVSVPFSSCGELPSPHDLSKMLMVGWGIPAMQQGKAGTKVQFAHQQMSCRLCGAEGNMPCSPLPSLGCPMWGSTPAWRHCPEPQRSSEGSCTLAGPPQALLQNQSSCPKCHRSCCDPALGTKQGSMSPASALSLQGTFPTWSGANRALLGAVAGMQEPSLPRVLKGTTEHQNTNHSGREHWRAQAALCLRLSTAFLTAQRWCPTLWVLRTNK